MDSTEGETPVAKMKSEEDQQLKSLLDSTLQGKSRTFRTFLCCKSPISRVFYPIQSLYKSSIVSRLSYQYVNLRQVVYNHDKRYVTSKRKMKKAIQLKEPALIVTQKAEDDKGIHGFEHTYLKHEITPTAVCKFMALNKDNLTMSKSGNIVFQKTPTISPASSMTESLNQIDEIQQLIDELGEKDADIVEFDDENAFKRWRSELVFSIIVNRCVPTKYVFILRLRMIGKR